MKSEHNIYDNIVDIQDFLEKKFNGLNKETSWMETGDPFEIKELKKFNLYDYIYDLVKSKGRLTETHMYLNYDHLSYDERYRMVEELVKEEDLDEYANLYASEYMVNKELYAKYINNLFSEYKSTIQILLDEACEKRFESLCFEFPHSITYDRETGERYINFKYLDSSLI